MHDFSWSAVVWGWLFCGVMLLIGKAIDHKNVIVNVREILYWVAMMALVVPGFLVGIPYLGMHLWSLFTDWAMLRDLLLTDLIVLPYLIGFFILWIKTTEKSQN
jgi:hypothetical protein